MIDSTPKCPIHQCMNCKKILFTKEETLKELEEEMPKLKDHTCRFNDGECECDCYKLAQQEILSIIRKKYEEKTA